MEGTRIRWSDHTWNVMSGCTKISPGCDICYAETIAEKFSGSAAFPVGFDPIYKPKKLNEAARLLRKHGPGRIFVNSMSDQHHEDFTWEQMATVYDEMLLTPEHDYLVLTKRPDRMARFFIGNAAVRNGRGAPTVRTDDGLLHHGPGHHESQGWLAMRERETVPGHIWLGTTVESDRYTFRADWLRTIPCPVRFISAEPLLEAVPSLDLTGLAWIIAGGESGRGYRPMDHDWARDLRDRCAEADVAFYFKQSAAPRTEMGIELDGRLHEEYPFAHPSVVSTAGPRAVGRYTDALALA